MRTPQTPIGSGFGAASTCRDVISGHDLSGQVAIVTGGHSGLGLETSRTLAAAGATVIVAARDADKARAALAAIPDVAVDSLDLMDPVSIDGFAGRFLASGRPLHLLVNNAGTMMQTLVRDCGGNEGQFSTNHLGHFRLTARLWPALRRAEGARVIALSSRGHRMAGVEFEDPNFERRAYDRWASYGQAKTANALFAVALDALGKPHGVRAFSLHPGNVMTGFVNHVTQEEMQSFGIVDEAGRVLLDPARGNKTVEQGAATTIWCAVSPQLSGLGGVYCEDCDIATPIASGAAGPGVRTWATDPALADRLWQLSETLTGVSLAG